MTAAYYQDFDAEEKQICESLHALISAKLPSAENKIWHAHPVWFLDGNPIVGFSKQKKGIQLMFWSGADFDEPGLVVRAGKFKDAAICYQNSSQIDQEMLVRCLEKSVTIQWDYKNIVKRKGQLLRLFQAVLLAIMLLSFRSDNLPTDFQALLTRAQMTFDAPPKLVMQQCIENRQMNYEYALKHPKKKFEIRYAIRPLDIQIEKHKEWEKNKKPGDISIHPNKLYNPMLQATLLNISGGQLPDINAFGKAAVAKEFNADWGATAFASLDKEFGQDYKYCLVVALHKDNVADAYIFYLANDRNVILKNMEPAFHALRFK
jgi:hypothetical protein